MKRGIFLGIMALIVSGLFSSCCRSRCDVWEDTKTCGRYMKKGVSSLFGRHIDSRDYAAFYENWDEDPDFVALADNENQNFSMHDYAPISKESPGDPGSKIPGIEGFATPSGKLAQLFNKVHFDTDNYSIKGSENLSTLREIANYLTAHPNTYVFVEGHADERGAAAYNLALGSRRANSVRTFLIQNGVNPDQLFTISYGKERPVAHGHEESSWFQNRRAQFKTYAK